MEALRERVESALDVILVGTWMLCERTETAGLRLRRDHMLQEDMMLRSPRLQKLQLLYNSRALTVALSGSVERTPHPSPPPPPQPCPSVTVDPRKEFLVTNPNHSTPQGGGEAAQVDPKPEPRMTMFFLHRERDSRCVLGATALLLASYESHYWPP